LPSQACANEVQFFIRYVLLGSAITCTGGLRESFRKPRFPLDATAPRLAYFFIRRFVNRAQDDQRRRFGFSPIHAINWALSALFIGFLGARCAVKKLFSIFVVNDIARGSGSSDFRRQLFRSARYR